jgi:hypothetical protein
LKISQEEKTNKKPAKPGSSSSNLPASKARKQVGGAGEIQRKGCDEMGSDGQIAVED